MLCQETQLQIRMKFSPVWCAGQKRHLSCRFRPPLVAADGQCSASSTNRKQVRSDAPPASGLGSSAALGVAAIGALSRYHGRNLLAHEVARESQFLEVEELKLESGVQDQLASAYGGVSFMEVGMEKVSGTVVDILSPCPPN